MTEVFTWPEGSAYIWSGNSTTSALLTFARNATVVASVTRHAYRPPFAAARVYTEIDRRATLTIGQAFSQKDLLGYTQNAAGGIVHCHVKYTVPAVGISGGMFLWTGSIESNSINGSDGGEVALSIQGTFDNWSAY